MGRRSRWRRRRRRRLRGCEVTRFAAVVRRGTTQPRNHATSQPRHPMFYEIAEAFRIAFTVIRAHKMRSVLTCLGVIIGIVAVTLMGSAISGIEIGFERSLSVIGDDLLYVEKWPWHHVDDWWNYRNRRRMEPRYADEVKRMIRATPNSTLLTAVPTINTIRNIKYADNEVRGVFTQGTTDEFLVTSTADRKSTRLNSSH